MPPRTSARTDEFAEAAQVISGPAGNPECVWLGRRVVRLMWRDDLDTAFRHLDLYDRFGCPGGHIQAAFRCLTRFGGQIDPKVAETLDSRVHACWINPASQPQQAAAARLAAGRADLGQCAAAAGREPLAGGKPVTGAPEIAAIVSAAVQERSAIEAIGTAAHSEIVMPSYGHEAMTVVKPRGRGMLHLPRTWSDLGVGSASLPPQPLLV